MDLITRDYQTVSAITGPLLFVERVPRARIGETVTILLPEGEKRRGQVIEVSRQHTVIQVLETTSGIGARGTSIRFHESVAMLEVSLAMLGRRFNGIGEPIDGLPPVIPQERREITGRVINPAARDKPSDWIQTGISAIDGLNTLIRGQKLPIFSGSGLPAHAIASQIFRNARVRGKEEAAGDERQSEGSFAVVFAAMGIPYREAAYFLDELDRSGEIEETVVFLNLADDPAIERLLTPRCALTVAEYLAFTHGRQALVILTDMTNYCEALREIATAREEIPGRRGYPGYMYTDLASLYERAGRIRGRAGAITS